MVFDTLFDQKNTTFKPVTNTFRAVLDYFINKKNTFGILFIGNLTHGSVRSGNKMPISYYPTSVINRNLDTGSSTSFKRDNLKPTQTTVIHSLKATSLAQFFKH
ncbi:MAG: hypothetical protein HYX40_08320 [Sphingobacteriales bacterium]|nr:hypothetical protein [Sphingobacteriales bacterium]